jgi:hypothetical protein
MLEFTFLRVLVRMMKWKVQGNLAAKTFSAPDILFAAMAFSLNSQLLFIVQLFCTNKNKL